MSDVGPEGWRGVLEFGRTLGERRAARRRAREALAAGVEIGGAEQTARPAGEPAAHPSRPVAPKRIRLRSRRRPWAMLVFEIAFLLYLASAFRLADWWRGLPGDVGAILGVLLALAASSGFGLLAVLGLRNRQRRRARWQRVMFTWQQTRRTAAEGKGRGKDDSDVYAMHLVLSRFERGRDDRASTLEFRSVRGLTPAGLVEFAAQVYEHIGYQVRAVGRNGIDLRIVNPEGQTDFVICRQLQKPIGEENLRRFLGAMRRKPARIHLWVPGGFTAQARRWAASEKIFAADEKEIARLVEAAYRREVEEWSRERLND